MSAPDLINAGFEIGAGFAVLHHCWCLRRDREVRGISVLAVLFFTVWGVWNIFWYPWLGQVFSFVAGIFVTATNALYVGMLWYYRTNVADRSPSIVPGLLSAAASEMDAPKPRLRDSSGVPVAFWNDEFQRELEAHPLIKKLADEKNRRSS